MTTMTRMKIALVADEAMIVVADRGGAEKKHMNIQCNVFRKHKSNQVVGAI